MLTPEEYFELEPGEEASIQSIPRYNHAIDYLDIEARSVQNTRLQISDSEARQKTVVMETFWKSGENRIIETHDLDAGGASHWEMIVSTRIKQDPATTQILRFTRDQSGPVQLLSHLHIRENLDGSETEARIFPPEESGSGTIEKDD